MPPQLLAKSEGPDLCLDKPIMLVGRHQECDVQISSRKISRKHCLIALVHDYLVVRDLFSTNGIRINGKRVLEGSLKTGDELTIGNYLYEVNIHPAANGAHPPAAPKPRAHATLKDSPESVEVPIALPDPASRLLEVPIAKVPPPPQNIRDSQQSSIR